MDSLRNIVVLVALLAGGVAGYFIGSRSGQDAEKALAKLEAASKDGEAEHKKATAELQSQVTALSVKYEAEKQQINADSAARRDKLAAALAARDKAIGELKARGRNDQSEIRQLQVHLNDVPSPKDKQATLERIAILEGDKHSAFLEARGEQCLGLPVPKAVLATLREDKQ